MASNIYAVKCPNCKRSAIEDDYYKTGERYTFCLRCGYNYTKIIKNYSVKGLEYKEEINEGHGVFILTKKNGSRVNTMLNSSVTDEKLEEFKFKYMADEVNQQDSYLVSYEKGTFKLLLGIPPENFFLPFEEYKTKMFTKYGKPEYDFMVPLEE